MKKLVASITTLIFASTTIAWSAPALPLAPAVSVTKPSITIPEEFGQIKESFQGSGPVLIAHIQDAHSHYEAQTNIRNILEYLSNHEKFSFVAVEGAARPLFPAAYHFFPHPDINRKIADYLTQKGELSGAEMYALELHEGLKQGKVDFAGVENPEIYRQDYELFQKVLAQKTEIKSYFEDLYGKLDREKSRVYSPEFLKFDRAVRSYEGRSMNLVPFISMLEKKTKEILKVELSHPLAQADWPYLCRMLRVRNAEPGLNLEAVSKDIERLKSIANEKIKDTKQRESITKGLEALATPSGHSLTQFYEITGLAPREFFESLYAASLKYQFPLEGYAALRQFAEHFVLQSELKGPEFFAEIDALVRKLSDQLATTPEAKELLDRSRNVRSLEKLFKLEATSEEWEKIKIQKSKVKNKEAQSAFHNFDFCALSFEFYELAERRNAVLLENTLAKMKAGGTKRAVLITGGFHTSGLTSLLRQKNISYVVIAPRIHEEFSNERYEEAMLGSWKTVFDQAKIQRVLGMVQELDQIKLMGKDPDRHVQVLLDGVVHLMDIAIDREISIDPSLAGKPEALVERLAKFLEANPHLEQAGLQIKMSPAYGEEPGQSRIVFSIPLIQKSFALPLTKATRITSTLTTDANRVQRIEADRGADLAISQSESRGQSLGEGSPSAEELIGQVNTTSQGSSLGEMGVIHTENRLIEALKRKGEYNGNIAGGYARDAGYTSTESKDRPYVVPWHLGVVAKVVGDRVISIEETQLFDLLKRFPEKAAGPHLFRRRGLKIVIRPWDGRNFLALEPITIVDLPPHKLNEIFYRDSPGYRESPDFGGRINTLHTEGPIYLRKIEEAISQGKTSQEAVELVTREIMEEYRLDKELVRALSDTGHFEGYIVLGKSMFSDGRVWAIFARKVGEKVVSLEYGDKERPDVVRTQVITRIRNWDPMHELFIGGSWRPEPDARAKGIIAQDSHLLDYSDIGRGRESFLLHLGIMAGSLETGVPDQEIVKIPIKMGLDKRGGGKSLGAKMTFNPGTGVLLAALAGIAGFACAPSRGRVEPVQSEMSTAISSPVRWNETEGTAEADLAPSISQAIRQGLELGLDLSVIREEENIIEVPISNGGYAALFYRDHPRAPFIRIPPWAEYLIFDLELDRSYIGLEPLRLIMTDIEDPTTSFAPSVLEGSIPEPVGSQRWQQIDNYILDYALPSAERMDTQRRYRFRIPLKSVPQHRSGGARLIDAIYLMNPNVNGNLRLRIRAQFVREVPPQARGDRASVVSGPAVTQPPRDKRDKKGSLRPPKAHVPVKRKEFSRFGGRRVVGAQSLGRLEDIVYKLSLQFQLSELKEYLAQLQQISSWDRGILLRDPFSFTLVQVLAIRGIFRGGEDISLIEEAFRKAIEEKERSAGLLEGIMRAEIFGERISLDWVEGRQSQGQSLGNPLIEALEQTGHFEGKLQLWPDTYSVVVARLVEKWIRGSHAVAIEEQWTYLSEGPYPKRLETPRRVSIHAVVRKVESSHRYTGDDVEDEIEAKVIAELVLPQDAFIRDGVDHLLVEGPAIVDEMANALKRGHTPEQVLQMALSLLSRDVSSKRLLPFTGQRLGNSRAEQFGGVVGRAFHVVSHALRGERVTRREAVETLAMGVITAGVMVAAASCVHPQREYGTDAGESDSIGTSGQGSVPTPIRSEPTPTPSASDTNQLLSALISRGETIRAVVRELERNQPNNAIPRATVLQIISESGWRDVTMITLSPDETQKLERVLTLAREKIRANTNLNPFEATLQAYVELFSDEIYAPSYFEQTVRSGDRHRLYRGDNDGADFILHYAVSILENRFNFFIQEGQGRLIFEGNNGQFPSLPTNAYETAVRMLFELNEADPRQPLTSEMVNEAGYRARMEALLRGDHDLLTPGFREVNDFWLSEAEMQRAQTIYEEVKREYVERSRGRIIYEHPALYDLIEAAHLRLYGPIATFRDKVIFLRIMGRFYRNDVHLARRVILDSFGRILSEDGRILWESIQEYNNQGPRLYDQHSQGASHLPFDHFWRRCVERVLVPFGERTSVRLTSGTEEYLRYNRTLERARALLQEDPSRSSLEVARQAYRELYGEIALGQSLGRARSSFLPRLATVLLLAALAGIPGLVCACAPTIRREDVSNTTIGASERLSGDLTVDWYLGSESGAYGRLPAIDREYPGEGWVRFFGPHEYRPEGTVYFDRAYGYPLPQWKGAEISPRVPSLALYRTVQFRVRNTSGEQLWFYLELKNEGGHSLVTGDKIPVTVPADRSWRVVTIRLPEIDEPVDFVAISNPTGTFEMDPRITFSAQSLGRRSPVFAPRIVTALLLTAVLGLVCASCSSFVGRRPREEIMAEYTDLTAPNNDRDWDRAIHDSVTYDSGAFRLPLMEAYIRGRLSFDGYEVVEGIGDDWLRRIAADFIVQHDGFRDIAFQERTHRDFELLFNPFGYPDWVRMGVIQPIRARSLGEQNIVPRSLGSPLIESLEQTGHFEGKLQWRPDTYSVAVARLVGKWAPGSHAVAIEEQWTYLSEGPYPKRLETPRRVSIHAVVRKVESSHRYTGDDVEDEIEAKIIEELPLPQDAFIRDGVDHLLVEGPAIVDEMAKALERGVIPKQVLQIALSRSRNVPSNRLLPFAGQSLGGEYEEAHAQYKWQIPHDMAEALRDSGSFIGTIFSEDRGVKDLVDIAGETYVARIAGEYLVLWHERLIHKFFTPGKDDGEREHFRKFRIHAWNPLVALGYGPETNFGHLALFGTLSIPDYILIDAERVKAIVGKMAKRLQMGATPLEVIFLAEKAAIFGKDHFGFAEPKVMTEKERQAAEKLRREVVEIVSRVHPALRDIENLIGKEVEGQYNLQLTSESGEQVVIHKNQPFRGKLIDVSTSRSELMTGRLAGMHYELILRFEKLEFEQMGGMKKDAAAADGNISLSFRVSRDGSLISPADPRIASPVITEIKPAGEGQSLGTASDDLDDLKGCVNEGPEEPLIPDHLVIAREVAYPTQGKGALVISGPAEELIAFIRELDRREYLWASHQEIGDTPDRRALFEFIRKHQAGKFENPEKAHSQLEAFLRTMSSRNSHRFYVDFTSREPEPSRRLELKFWLNTGTLEQARGIFEEIRAKILKDTAAGQSLGKEIVWALVLAGLAAFPIACGSSPDRSEERQSTRVARSLDAFRLSLLMSGIENDLSRAGYRVLDRARLQEYVASLVGRAGGGRTHRGLVDLTRERLATLEARRIIASGPAREEPSVEPQPPSRESSIVPPPPSEEPSSIIPVTPPPSQPQTQPQTQPALEGTAGIERQRTQTRERIEEIERQIRTLDQRLQSVDWRISSANDAVESMEADIATARLLRSDRTLREEWERAHGGEGAERLAGWSESRIRELREQFRNLLANLQEEKRGLEVQKAELEAQRTEYEQAPEPQAASPEGSQGQGQPSRGQSLGEAVKESGVRTQDQQIGAANLFTGRIFSVAFTAVEAVFAAIMKSWYPEAFAQVSGVPLSPVITSFNQALALDKTSLLAAYAAPDAFSLTIKASGNFVPDEELLLLARNPRTVSIVLFYGHKEQAEFYQEQISTQLDKNNKPIGNRIKIIPITRGTEVETVQALLDPKGAEYREIAELAKDLFEKPVAGLPKQVEIYKRTTVLASLDILSELGGLFIHKLEAVSEKDLKSLEVDPRAFSDLASLVALHLGVVEGDKNLLTEALRTSLIPQNGIFGWDRSNLSTLAAQIQNAIQAYQRILIAA